MFSFNLITFISNILPVYLFFTFTILYSNLLFFHVFTTRYFSSSHVHHPHSLSHSLTHSLTLSLNHSLSPSLTPPFSTLLPHPLIYLHYLFNSLKAICSLPIHLQFSHTSSLPSSLPFSLSLSFRLPPSIYHSRCLSLLIFLFFGQPSHSIRLSHFLPFPLPHLFALKSHSPIGTAIRGAFCVDLPQRLPTSSDDQKTSLDTIWLG